LLAALMPDAFIGLRVIVGRNSGRAVATVLVAADTKPDRALMQKTFLCILFCLTPWLQMTAADLAAETETGSSEATSAPAAAAPAADTTPAVAQPTQTEPTAVAPVVPAEPLKPAPVAPETTNPIPALEPTTPVEKPSEPSPPTTPPIVIKPVQPEAPPEKKEPASPPPAPGFFAALLQNSKVYTGVAGGLGISFNSMHASGYLFGVHFDYMAYERYGFHFGLETGQFSSKSAALAAGSNTMNVQSGGTFGYLTFDFSLYYGLPKFLGLRPVAGLGFVIYRLTGGDSEFINSVAPRFTLGTYYPIFGNIEVGLLANLTLPSATQVKTTAQTYTLDSSQSLATGNLQLLIRYSWF
jgi:hypothetical protein